MIRRKLVVVILLTALVPLVTSLAVGLRVGQENVRAVQEELGHQIPRSVALSAALRLQAVADWLELYAAGAPDRAPAGGWRVRSLSAEEARQLPGALRTAALQGTATLATMDGPAALALFGSGAGPAARVAPEARGRWAVIGQPVTRALEAPTAAYLLAGQPASLLLTGWEDLTRATGSGLGQVRLSLVDPSGEVVASIGSLGGAEVGYTRSVPLAASSQAARESGGLPAGQTGVDALLTGWSVRLEAPPLQGGRLAAMARLTWTGVGVLAVVLALTSWLFAGTLTRPVVALIEAARRIGRGGEYGSALDTVRRFAARRDEIGTLAGAFVAMTEHLQSLIEHTRKAATELVGEVTSLTRGSAELERGINQISETVRQMATTSESQARTAQTVDGQARSAGAAIHQAATVVEEVAHKAEAVAGEARQGLQMSRALTAELERAEAAVRALTEEAGRLGSHSKAIGRVVEAMAAVADQTNLLALNASIEAARAGEHGRGFGVVAEEIRKLAGQAHDSTREIGALLDTVQATIERVVKTTTEAGTRIKEQIEAGARAAAAFDAVGASAVQLSEQAGDVREATRRITDGIEQIVRAVQEFVATTQEAAAAAQEASAMVQEQIESLQRMAASLHSLDRLARSFEAARRGEGPGPSGADSPAPSADLPPPTLRGQAGQASG